MFPIASASVKITPDFTGFAASTRAGTQAALSQTAANARQLGAGLTAAVTLPVAAIGATAVRSFADFDKAITESLAIVQDFGSTTRADFEETARSVATSTTFSASEAAEAFFFLASAGLTAEQQLQALEPVAQFAQAGMFDLATATDLATDAQSALGLTVPDAEQNLENLVRVTDTLVGANTLANASVEQFSESLTNKAGTALKILNKDIEEGVAVLALYADRGIKGQVAGELLSRTLKFLNIRAVENAEEFERLGIEVFDTDGKMRNLADISEDLTGALQDLSDEERTAELNLLGFTGRTQDAILTLIGGEDQIRNYEAALRDLGGITQTVADRQLQSFDAQLKIAQSRIADVGLTIGEQLIPFFVSAAEGVATLVEAFAAAPTPVKRFVGALAGIAALAGPVLLIGGSIAKSILALQALRATSARGVTSATAYAAAQGRAAAATNALGISAGRASVGVGALSNAQLRGSLVGGGAAGRGLLAGVGRGAAFAAGGFLAGDLVGGLIQTIETEEGTVGDTVKDTVGNAVRFGATGAGIGFSIGGPVGAGIGAAVGAIGGGIVGFFQSDRSGDVEEAAETVRNRIADVFTDLELSDREQQAAAAILDGAVQSIIQTGIEDGLSQIEAAGLGDQAEEVIVRLLEFGIDPDTAAAAVREKVTAGLAAGLSPAEIAASIQNEISRGELFGAVGADIAGDIATGIEEELAPSFAEVFVEAQAAGASILDAIQAGVDAGVAIDLGFVTDQIAGQISTVPSIFEEQFEEAKTVSTQKILEIAQANADAFASFETDIRTLAEAGLFALADTLAQEGPAAAAQAAALAEDIPTAIAIEAELSGLARDGIEAFLAEFEGADVDEISQQFIARFVDPILAADLKAEADAKARELLEADEAYKESAFELASTFGTSINEGIDAQTTTGFDDFGVRASGAVEDQLSLTRAREIAAGFAGEIQSALAGFTFRVPAPTIDSPRVSGGAPRGGTGDGLQRQASTRNVEVNIYNPQVQSADRDAQKALVLDRVQGAI